MTLACRSCGSALADPVIERVTVQDLPALRRFLGSFTGADLLPEETDYLFCLRSRENGTEIIGTVELFPCKNKVFYLCRVKVARHVRRQGIGSFLFAFALEQAKTAGAREVLVVTRQAPHKSAGQAPHKSAGQAPHKSAGQAPTAPAVRIVQKLGAHEAAPEEIYSKAPPRLIARYSLTNNRFWRFTLQA